MSKQFNFSKNGISIVIDIDSQSFINPISLVDGTKYIKGVLTNKERLINRFIKPIKETSEKSGWETDKFINNVIDTYDQVEPFTYAEAFKIEDPQFRATVFGSINVSEMIETLGATRVATDGKHVNQKVYSESGEFLGYHEFDNIYEVHEVSGEKLGLEENLYALKCWCTTTNKEHWLWIEDQYKDSPLEAVASTFRIHENLIPHIKEIKRQGDILLVELNQDVEPQGNIVPLTAEQYFGFLTAQS
jgi:hypothetical protein